MNCFLNIRKVHNVLTKNGLIKYLNRGTVQQSQANLRFYLAKDLDFLT